MNDQKGVLSLCGVICYVMCPPIPSSITRKVAFLPPSASYNIIETEDGNLVFISKDTRNWAALKKIVPDLQVHYVTTQRNQRIPMLYLSLFADAKYTIIYSHGNATDAGSVIEFCHVLAKILHCNICIYDYSGYGKSSGTPSEKNLYADIRAVWEFLISQYNLKKEDIILYGESIGSAPTVDLASKVQCGGVIVHAGLSSGLRILFPWITKTYFIDPFKNVEKISRVRSPVLFIHGTEDEVVNIDHAFTLFRKCPNPVNPLWIDGADHHNIRTYNCYVERLIKFIDEDLQNP